MYGSHVNNRTTACSSTGADDPSHWQSYMPASELPANLRVALLSHSCQRQHSYTHKSNIQVSYATRQLTPGIRMPVQYGASRTSQNTLRLKHGTDTFMWSHLLPYQFFSLVSGFFILQLAQAVGHYKSRPG